MLKNIWSLPFFSKKYQLKTYIQQIKLHLSMGELAQVFPLLNKLAEEKPQLQNEWILLSGRYHRNEKDFAMGIMARDQYDMATNRITHAVNQILDKHFSQSSDIPLSEAPVASPRKTSKKDVFISYSHKNTAIAKKVKDRLEKEGIQVQIDEYEMHPGIDVYEYIKSAVQNSNYTLSIISADSLLSTWVTVETLGTFQNEHVYDHPRFIPCYIDKSFMDRDFTLKSVKQIDEEIEALDKIIIEQSALKIDTQNLNEDKTRLYDLRNNIGAIIGRLKRTKCMNISEDYFEENMRKVVERIRTQNN